MKKFSSVTWQLFGFLALSVLMMGGFFGFSLFYSLQSRDFLREAQSTVALLNQAKEIRFFFGSARKAEKNWLLFQTPNYLEIRKKDLNKSRSLLMDFRPPASVPKVTGLVEALQEDWMRYAALGSDLEKVKRGKEIEVFTKKAKDLEASVVEDISEISNLLLQQMEAYQIQAGEEFYSYLQGSLVILCLGLFFFIGIGVFWLRHFKNRLEKLVFATQKMAVGDYSPQLQISSSDELGTLAANFNEMGNKIAEREEKINQITQELIQTNNLLKKGIPAISQNFKTKA